MMSPPANDVTIRIPDEEIASQEENGRPIPTLVCMPNEILSKIFVALNDIELSNVAGTCTRFEPIAQLIFEERYAAKYFVIHSKYTKSMYDGLIEQFHGGIKSIEVQNRNGISNGHWIMQLCRKCPIERFKFVDCIFANVKSALSNHPNLTHLSFQGGCGYSFVKLPNLHNLREFKVRHFDGMYYADYLQVIRNNRQLKVIEIVDDSVNEPYEIIECVHQNHQNLDQLHVINEAKPLKLDVLPDALNIFESVAKCVESLGISTDNNSSIEYLRRLSINCKNIQRLELFHVDHTLSNEVAEAIGLFDQINSLSLVFKSYEERIVSIAEKLPNLNHLSLKYRVRTPTSNDYILNLLQKCGNLENIVVDTHIDRFKPKQPSITAQFRGEFNKLMENRKRLAIFELKEEGRTITTVECQNNKMS